MHTLEAAEKTHGDGEAAHRIALGSLKHSFEKVGDVAKRLDITGRSRMTKDELVKAINKANRSETAKSLRKKNGRS